MGQAWVNDISDHRLEPYRELNRSNLTRWSGRFVVEGKHLVHRLAASRFPVHSILVSERYLEDLPANLPTSVEILVTPHALIDTIIGFDFHRGMLACGERLAGPSLDDLFAAMPPTSLWCACDRILDPTNLGSVIRNAAAMGVDGMVIGPRSADPFSRRALRVSMGTALQLPIVEAARLEQTLGDMQRRWNVELIATALDPRAEDLPQATRGAHTALVFGSEGDGVAPEVLAVCGRVVTLPMAWQTDSLNVAAASAVFLYHFAHVANRHLRDA